MQTAHHSEEEKYEYEQLSNKKSLSIKSEQIVSAKKWEDIQQVEK